ncbi:uncharacterized protein LOC143775542 isoform X2 [Ranitomeya variabilis]
MLIAAVTEELHSVLPNRLRKRRALMWTPSFKRSKVGSRCGTWRTAAMLTQFVTRRLWEEVCSAVLDNWEELDAGAQDLARNRVIVRWRSLRDRFKREFNKEMQAPSGSRGRRSSTVCSTREPASELHPSGAISQESATWDHVDPSVSVPSLLCDPSAPSTSAGAAGRTSSLEATGDELVTFTPPL